MVKECYKYVNKKKVCGYCWKQWDRCNNECYRICKEKEVKFVPTKDDVLCSCGLWYKKSYIKKHLAGEKHKMMVGDFLEDSDNEN